MFTYMYVSYGPNHKSLLSPIVHMVETRVHMFTDDVVQWSVMVQSGWDIDCKYGYIASAGKFPAIGGDRGELGLVQMSECSN